MSSRLLKVEDWERLAAEAMYEAERMASLCHISLRQLERLFKVQFKQSPSDWMRVLWYRRAGRLIASGYSTGAAAEELGFANASHLCHEFKKVYGVPPPHFAPGAGRVGGG